MIRCFVKYNHKLEIIDDINSLQDNPDKLKSVVWIDMISPSIDEIKTIEKLFVMSFPTKQESEEIEISSRFWEEDKRIEINSYFLINNDQNPRNETVSFILQDEKLISIRYANLRSFDEMSKKLVSSPKEFKDGYCIFSQIIDIRIDADADIIEHLAKEITKLRRHVFTDYANEDEEILEKISLFEDLNMKIRENLTDKQRILSALLRSNQYHEFLKNDTKIMLNDIKSLIEHTNFNFERLDYLQSIFFGILSIEQNKVIKIFTIVNVIFLPPTLIASIYGMNFDFIPELHFRYGYAMSIVLMIVASLLPIYIFKKKGWV